MNPLKIFAITIIIMLACVFLSSLFIITSHLIIAKIICSIGIGTGALIGGGIFLDAIITLLFDD